jgi:hypothetical protein
MAALLMGLALVPATTAHAVGSLSGTGTAVSATEGTAFTGQTASFTDSNNTDTASDFSATIDWGDGTTTAATVGGSAGGPFSVSGSHTYADEGSFTVTSTLTPNAGPAATATSTATVAEADVLTVHPIQPSPSTSEGTTFTGRVANFINSNAANNTPADLTATIDWGDGTTTAGAVSNPAGKIIAVDGSHAYADEGTYTITTTLADDAPGSATATANTTATVSGDDPVVTGTSFGATEGSSFAGPTATFTDPSNGAAIATDFGATIDWGDGTTTAATVSGPSAGVFTVSGTHTYADEGSFSVLTTVTPNGQPAAAATATSTATVAEADVLTVHPIQPAPLSTSEGTTFTGRVANFINSNAANNTPVDLTATIDWGDGTTTAGAVSNPTGDVIAVDGSHAYADEGTYTITTTLADDAPGSATATANTTATIADAALTPSPTTSAESSGVPFSDTVATFTDANTLADATDFTATIDWGDGTTTAGTVSGPPFEVTGNHTYASPGSYAVTVPIHDGSQVVTAHSTINVSQACPPGSTLVTGNVSGRVVVRAGSNVCINGATTTGGVSVRPGGSVTILDSTIGGTVTSSRASAFTLCNTTVTGTVVVTRASGDVTIGDDTDLCGGNNIHGSLTVSNNRAGLELFGNTVGGVTVVVNNAGVSSPAEEATPEVEQNTIGGRLSCAGNTPGLTDGGLPNSAPAKTGQCATL